MASRGRGAHRLEVDRASVTLDAEDGGRLTSLSVGGVELLGGVGSEVLEHGSFVMAPWAGRIRDGRLRVGTAVHQLPTVRTHPHAGHGLVVDRPWQVLDASPEHVVLRCDLDARWPFTGHVVQHVRLGSGRLDQRVEVHAHDEPFPATVGWHPWFPRVLAGGARAQLRLAVDAMLQRDAAGIPSGALVPVPPGPWDDCFSGVTWPITIEWPDALSLRIDADVDYVVVFDEREPAFCVEPQSGPPDGPNTAPHLVAPGSPLVATTRWAWA